jgi:Tfp pilus assembly protein FimT
MQLVSKILFPHRVKSVRARLIRGLSTAELVGIIVIVGILGALGGTYISGLIKQSKNNTGLQNAQSLTTTLSSALAGGATIAPGGAAGTIDTTSSTTAITALNNGVTVTNPNGTTITYQMNPQINIANAGNYTLSATNTFGFTADTSP